jgi:hypothetical protein
VVYQRTALLDLERGNGVTGSGVHEGRRQTARCEDLAVNGKARLIYRPSSRTGENPLSGMIGGTMETAASFEARFAPWSYPATSRWQQGLIATCKDSSNEAKAEGEESQRGWAHESV